MKVDERVARARTNAAELARVRERIALTSGEDKITVNSSNDWLNAKLQKARENPGLLLYKVQSDAYKFSWALILLSTPLVALLFLWRRRFNLYDHATFTTYSITFMSLLLIVVQLFDAIGTPSWLTASLMVLAPPAHMFRQLRGTYGLRAFSALWRTVALLFFALTALTAFVLAVIVKDVA